MVAAEFHRYTLWKQKVSRIQIVEYWCPVPQGFARHCQGQLNLTVRKLGVDLAKLITYGNCALYLISTFALSNGLIEVSAGDQWQSENSTQGAVLIGLLAFSILVTISCFLGLLLRKDWGRKAAFLWNLSLALIFGVVPFSSILIVYGVRGLEAILNAERLIGILVGVLLVVFALGLRNQAVIDYFKNENRSAI